jgi:hypothetical protein
MDIYERRIHLPAVNRELEKLIAEQRGGSNGGPKAMNDDSDIPGKPPPAG